MLIPVMQNESVRSGISRRANEAFNYMGTQPYILETPGAGVEFFGGESLLPFRLIRVN